jgi:adenine phosphoribosyltransferase
MSDEFDRAVATSFRWIDGHADVWALLAEPAVLRELGPRMAEPFCRSDVTAVVAIESRGFIVGPLVALQLGARFVAVPKRDGLLPGRKLTRTTANDYRGNTAPLRLQHARLSADDRVLLVDDWAETGSQLAAAATMVADRGATVVGTTLLVNELDDPPPKLGRVHAVMRETSVRLPAEP